jgi:histidinol-phosphate aminotransferase
MVRISAPSSGELRRLDAELARVLGTERQIGKVLPARSGGPGDRRALLAAVGGALVAAPPLRAVRRSSPATRWNPTDPADPLSLTRRQLMLRAALGAAGSAGLLAALSRPGEALAFPPDSFYDTFNLARMIYHENPVGPSSAALDAVRQVIARGPTAARRLEETDQRDLVNAVLRYNRGRSAAVKKLTPANVMLLMGSAEGLFLAVDALVAGGRLISEWPSYRIIRERTWQGGGTVIDVLLDPATRRPNYPALREALKQHPETRLIHFNVQNNPMGTVLRRAEFDPFARHVFRNHPRTVIIADESDREFMEAGRAVSVPDFPAYVARGDNLIHLQTFSHAFALTGLRVGYLFAPQHLIRRLERKRIPRPVNVFGHAAALASLRDPRPQIARSHKTIDEGRRYLYAELDKLGLQYSRSQGQYLMVDTGRSGTAVWAGLISLGVLTRYGREWGMEGWLRVNPGLPDENERFIAALRTVLNEPDPGNLPDPPFPIDDLLPGGNRAIAADLERRLRRDSWLATRLPGFEGPIRVTPAAALGTSRR